MRRSEVGSRLAGGGASRRGGSPARPLWRPAVFAMAAVVTLTPLAAGAATDLQSVRERLEVARPALRAALKPYLRAADAQAFPDDKPGVAFGKYVDQALRVLDAKTSFPDLHSAMQGNRKRLDPGNELQRQALAVFLGDYLQVRYGDDLRRELGKLVGFKTYNNVVDRNADNPEFHKCFDYLANLARALGLRVRNDAYETLEITLPAAAAGNAAPLAVWTHADVVTVVERRWTSPPFELKERNNRWWGLGTYDDKGPLLVNLLALRVLRDADLTLARPIALVVSATGEEPGADVAQCLSKLPVRPAVTLAADGEFPYASGENGRLIARVTSSRGMKKRTGIKQGEFYIQRLKCLMSMNTVPAEARVWVMYAPPANSNNPALDMLNRWRKVIESYQKAHPAAQYETYVQDDTLHFFVYGKPQHSDLAAAGESSILDAAGALVGLPLYRNGGSDLMLWLDKGIQRDPSGRALGLAYEDPDMGSTAVNPVAFERLAEDLSVLVDVRFPVGHDAAWVRERLAASIATFNKQNAMALQLDWEPGGYEPLRSEPPAAVARVLSEAYRLASGEAAPAAAVTHGSARLLPAAIPFGPEWPEIDKRGQARDESISQRELQDLGTAYLSALAALASVAALGTTP